MAIAVQSLSYAYVSTNFVKLTIFWTTLSIKK